MEIGGASCIVVSGVNDGVNSQPNGHILAWVLNQRYYFVGQTADGSPYYKGDTTAVNGLPSLYLVYDHHSLLPGCSDFGPGWYVVDEPPSENRVYNVMAERYERCKYRAFIAEHPGDPDAATTHMVQQLLAGGHHPHTPPTGQVQASSVWCGAVGYLSGPQTLTITTAPFLPPPSSPPPVAPPVGYSAQTSVQLQEAATASLSAGVLTAKLIAAVGSSADSSEVTIRQVTSLSVSLDAEPPAEAVYLPSVQSSVCGSTSGCEVRVASTRRQLLSHLLSDRFRLEAADVAAEEAAGAAEAGAGEATGHTMDRAAAVTGWWLARESTWLGRAVSRALGRPLDANASFGDAEGSTNGSELHGREDNRAGTPDDEEEGREATRRLQGGGSYVITFEIVLTPTASDTLDTSVTATSLAATLAAALGSATGATATLNSPVVTATSATISFSQAGSSENAAAAASSTLASGVLTDSLASSLGVSASDVFITDVSFSFPPRAPPLTPPTTPAAPPPSPPPYSEVRTSACDACRCNIVAGSNNWFDDNLCLGECTWQTEMLRRSCPYIV